MKKFKKYKKKNNYFFIIIILIISLTMFLYNYVSNSFTTKVLKITEFNLEKFSSDIVLGKLKKEFVTNDVLIINKNNSGEITYLDYNLPNSYELLDKFVDKVNDNLLNFSKFEFYEKNIDTDNNSFIISYPIGIISDSVFMNNLGPKIPVRINLIDNISTNLKTRISNYGINTLLIEMYITVELKNEIVMSKIYDCTYNYELLIASKVIQGSIPNYYGGVVEKNLITK